MIEPDREFERVYLEQCWDDWRQYDSIIWRSPSVTAAIVGALVGIAYYAVQDLLVRDLIIFLASLFALAMTIGLHKHRYFQRRRTERIDGICLTRLGYESPIHGDRKDKSGRVRAYVYLFAATAALFISTFVLGVIVLIEYLA